MSRINQTLFPFLIILLLMGYSNNMRASLNVKPDSVPIAQIVNDFYDWYLKAIKDDNSPVFKPTFVATENGMTTLDCTSYFSNLRKYQFSESLIMHEKDSYTSCIENLSSVKFQDFQNTMLTNLDEYEQSNCDFGNYFRWTGGQEPIDGIQISGINFIALNSALVKITYFEIEPSSNTKVVWGENRLILIKVDGG
jgi:hypothetical protein